MRWFWFAGVLAFTLLSQAAIGHTDDAGPPQPSVVVTPASSTEELTERVRRSVVVITSASRDGRRDALGSGFIISADGQIATNYHVIGEGREIRVQLTDGRTFDATSVFASDRQTDLAIIKIDAHDLPTLALGDSDAVQQGQNVLGLGNPQGLKNSVVAGLVSGVRDVDGRKMIQLAIPIEPGNSGGPLVDMQGRVQGILTMKSLVTPNLGFAVTVNALKPLVASPNPIPMSRWLTIGALDARQWKPLFGARWRQRAGRITVEGAGQGFGGRSLCLYQPSLPNLPLDLAVTVHLNDESGAAGLAFCSDGQDRHYGFYPTGGRVRLTRFDGPDLLSWTILYDQPSPHYTSGGWNTLRVRLDEGKIIGFVNDEKVVEIADPAIHTGQVGLVKFRETQAQFKNFRLARELPPASVAPAEIDRITRLLDGARVQGPLDTKLIESLASDATRAAAVARDQATVLEQRANRLRELADAAHAHRVIADLTRELARQEDQIDLFRAGLLVARLDNEEVDVESYRDELEQMGRELAGRLTPHAHDSFKLDLLRKYLFEENGFHGSRGDYYNRANSYLNEVLDDREGLPITLSIVYLELASRLGLNVSGVGIPGHFVVQHLAPDGKSAIIDVYDGGKVLSREEVARRLKQNVDRDPTDEDFAPATKRAIVARMLQNLLSVSGNNPKNVHRYLNAILAIAPDSAQHRWLRAIVRYQLHERAAALEDVQWLLANRPAGIEFGRVMELERALQAE